MKNQEIKAGEIKTSRRLKKYRQSIINFVVTGLLMLIQFTWITWLTYWATNEFNYVNMAISVAGIVISLYVASRDIRSVHKLSWAFLMLTLPIIGVPTYFMFGRPVLTRANRKRMESVYELSKPYRLDQVQLSQELRNYSQDAYLQSRYITEYGGYPLQRACDSKYYGSGEEMLPDFLEDLRSAKHFIFIEFFIVGEGEMFDQVLEILEQKVKEGVEVRLIYDDFGSTQVQPPRYDRILEAKGIKTIRFNPFRPFLFVTMNNRDHRKIMVVDNRVCYTGGVNLSDEYINIVPRFGYWKDAAVRMTGAPCNNFTVMFLEMWMYALKYRAKGKAKKQIPEPEFDAFLIPQDEKPEDIKKGFIQPYADSPLDHEYVGEVVYMNMINRAKEYVYIATPYLIIGSEMTAALINAAKSGVDVRIVVPAIPDKKLVYQLTKSNFRQLIKGGVKIYTYTPGFIHTKCFVSDDKFAVIGSINLDYRSLTLHFECASFHYETEAVLPVKEDLKSAMEAGKLVLAEECENKSVVKRTVLMILKLFAPMM